MNTITIACENETKYPARLCHLAIEWKFHVEFELTFELRFSKNICRGGEDKK
jgi:hypothetical protein